jgi:uncharacterized damage-inducible protein DinB
MTQADFKDLYVRELDNLHKEISILDEGNLWKTAGEIKNSPGNLCLHLIGNINGFIGNIIGKTGYVRKRDEEFSLKNVPKEELLESIAATKKMVEEVFDKMDADSLKEDFPVEILGKRNTEYMLAYFIGHFMYHLGQINYFRRMV